MKTTTKIRIAFDDVGDEEPALLLLPGWCSRRGVFRPLHGVVGLRTVAIDWRGHGASDPADADFGTGGLVEDALAVVEATGVRRVVPVGLAHAGFVAIELAKRLGPSRVPGVALVDWMVLGAPPPFRGALAALQDPERFAEVRAKLFAMWTEGVASRAVHEQVAEMGELGFDMWARAGREIAAGFEAAPVPVEALATLERPVLHVYAQPADDAFLAAQESYRASHPWFHVKRVAAASHFPMLEAPAEVGGALEAFARSAARAAHTTAGQWSQAENQPSTTAAPTTREVTASAGRAKP